MDNLIKNMRKIKNGEIISPFLIEFHPTNICNHNCKWCIAKEVKEAQWSYSFSSAEKLIKELAECNCGTVLFSGGGDPLCYNGIEKLLELSSSLGMETLLITNGGLLHTKDIELVSRCCDSIRISLDAANKAEHTEVHRPKNIKEDNYDIIIDNIDTLVKHCNKYNNKVVLTYVLDEGNVDKIINFIKLAEELNVSSIDVKTNHNLEANRKKELLKEYNMLVKDVNNKGKLEITIDEIKRRNTVVDESWNGLYVSGVIEANGELYPCCHTSLKEEWKIGNLNEDSFNTLWYGVNHYKIIDKSRNSQYCCPTCADSPLEVQLKKILEKI